MCVVSWGVGHRYCRCIYEVFTQQHRVMLMFSGERGLGTISFCTHVHIILVMLRSNHTAVSVTYKYLIRSSCNGATLLQAAGPESV